MRYLILSDLHSNWEALQAVLLDAKGDYDRIVSCGDLVGYGPEPNRIVEWARGALTRVIRGNHDRACCGMDDIEWFNPIAREATRWTLGALTPENQDYLRSLPPGPLWVEDFLLVHGSPLDEDEYVASMGDASNVFPYLESAVTFFGHTHLQGGFVWRHGRQSPVVRPDAAEKSVRYTIDSDSAWLINPGSVGQPRDSDPRAAYAVYDTAKSVVFLRRAAYDTEAVRSRMLRSGLPAALATRLALGR